MSSALSRTGYVTRFAIAIMVCGQLAHGAMAEKREPKDVSELSPGEREKAKKYFIAGSENFSKGSYSTAIEEFQKAYAIARSPEIIYNIGRCHEKLNEVDKAIYNYEMYLRFYPDAEDAEDVRHRINILTALKKKEGWTEAEEAMTEEAAQQETSDEDDQIEGDWWSGIRLGGSIGATFPVVGPWERPVVPIDLFLHYPMLDWLYLTGVFTFGFAAGKENSARGAEVENTVGLFLGAQGLLSVHELVNLSGRVGVLIAGLAREHQDRMVTWLSVEAAPGVIVEVYGPLRVLAEVVVDVGPMFVPSSGKVTPWDEDVEMNVSIGGMIGLEYLLDYDFLKYRD